MNKKILKFEADWCPPCKNLNKLLEDSVFEDIEIVRVDIDQPENSELLQEHQIRNIPTMVYFLNDEIVAKTVGVVSKDAILNKFVNENSI